MKYLEKQWKLSHTKACKAMQAGRNRKYYSEKQPARDEAVREAIEKILPGSRKGRKKVIPLVQRNHPEFGASRIRRVYVRSGFSLYQKPRHRLAGIGANPLPVCLNPNEEWAMDFMSDALQDGRRIRVLNIVDHYSRFLITSRIAFSIPAKKVIEHFENAIEMYGKPKRIRTDNGPEFRSKLFQLWCINNSIEWKRIQPGKPQQNGLVERLNRTFREDVLDANIFNSCEDAQRITDKYKIEYNECRPHESLNNLTPNELMVA